MVEGLSGHMAALTSLLVLVGCTEEPISADATSTGESSSATTQVETGTGSATSTETETESTSESETGDPPPPPPPPRPEAGFIELEGVSYELGEGDAAVAAQSDAARWFYAYQGARGDVDGDAPVFVFFNGGPGVSSGMLMGFNIGEATFAPSETGPDQAVVEGPAPWTELGHLVWIDARQTGFSYGLLDDPSDQGARAAAMNLDNFNAYRDAADFVRTLLRLLEAKPELRTREVVLVAESYGGIRAQLMLDMLLHPGAYEDGSRPLRDLELGAEIRAHHLALGVDPDEPTEISTQFGHQILIQPALTGEVQQDVAGELFEQPGSILDQIAAELGVSYTPCSEIVGPCDPYDHALDFVLFEGRSPYDVGAPATWLGDTFSLVGARLNDGAATEALLGVALEDLPAFVPRGRTQAWRAVNLGVFPTDAELGDWPDIAGPLQDWDRYFAPLNTEALFEFRSAEARALDIDPADAHFGERLLTNLAHVDTLVTHAALDIVIYAPSIPPALAGYDALVTGVEVEAIGDEGDELWRVHYRDDVGIEPPERTIFAPHYEAGHAVSLDSPLALREDVTAWLAR